jgi:crotonobetainyl-CoA:carnitine CoA-transferase CaiB-like acyl-CoA transferase
LPDSPGPPPPGWGNRIESGAIPAGPLHGVRVVDLTQLVAGPYCTKLLALYGATVIKVEPPGTGDAMRHIAPFVHNDPENDSLAFLDLNVDKLGVTLDLRTSDGAEILWRLFEGAHMIVESGKPGALARLGFFYEALKARLHNPVLVSISNFGQTGPYRDLPASELVLYAMGHEMHGTGLKGEEPMMTAPRLNLYLAGQTAAIAAMAALFAARMSDHGDWVDVSIMETLTSSIDRRADSLVSFAYTGEKMQRKSVESVGILPPYTPCVDGYIHMTLGSEIQWRRLQNAVGEDWIKSLEYPYPVPSEAASEFISVWRSWCKGRTKSSVIGMCQSAGVTCAPLNNVADLVDDEHLRARGYFVELDRPDTGRVLYPGLPLRFSDTPGELRRSAPALGQDTADVLADLGYQPDDLADLARRRVI